MTEGQPPKLTLECAIQYTLRDGSPLAVVAEGEAKARLYPHKLEVWPFLGQALMFSWREVTDVSAAAHRLTMRLTSGEQLQLHHAGYRFDDLHREVVRLRHELTIEDLLMQESLVAGGISGYFAWTRGGCEGSGEGGTADARPCEIRLYDTALLVMPQGGDLARIPYSSLTAVEVQDHRLRMAVEDEGELVLSQLGPQLDYVRRELSGRLNAMALATQQLLHELMPAVEPVVIRRASRLLRDGRAASRGDLAAVSADLWAKLESRLAEVGLAEKYAFLRTLSGDAEVWVGIKRGLLGDLTGEYLWALIPLYGQDPATPGNAVAMEAAAGPGGGKATYFFRLVSRSEYPRLAQESGALAAEASDFARQLNRCMLEINFRREPVYLSDERLSEPRYARYRHALRRIPGLGVLRERLIGRVIHRSATQWERDVLDLLEFNVSVADDNLKWRGGGGDVEQEEQDESAAMRGDN